jgi:AcrR family transcriptional regulator
MHAMSLATDRTGRLPRGQRRAQLLDAARTAFVQQGYHAAGMDSIAELAGVSKPVLYQHFPGKLELYLAVLDQSSESLIGIMRAALGSTTDNRKRVRGAIEAYFDFVSHQDGAFRLIFESDLNNVTEVAKRVARTDEICGQMIADVIRQDTSLDDETATLLASGLLGLSQTAARHWVANPNRIPQDEAVRALANLVWRGISAFPLTHPVPAAERKTHRGGSHRSPASRT